MFASVLFAGLLCKSFPVHAEQNGSLVRENGKIWEESALPALPGRAADSATRASHNSQREQKPLRAFQPDLTGQRHLSALERFYSTRAGQTLRQFGYRALGGADQSPAALSGERRLAGNIPRGQVADDFILGPGDEVRIVLTGQKNSRRTYKVNGQGQILIDDIGAVPAAGRKLSDLRAELTQIISKQYNIDVFVSLNSVRQIQVLIIGHVRNPGRLRISAFDSLLDALAAAGGIEKSGSLRNLRIIREGSTRQVDLYDLLFHAGADPDLKLQDGDRIIIPPIGPTLGVAGSVKRPGIYEIKSPPSSSSKSPPGSFATFHQEETRLTLSAQKALSLAGGLLTRGANRILSFSVDESGREITRHIPFEQSAKYEVSDSALLLVETRKVSSRGEIELKGHTTSPGRYDLQSTPTLSALLDSRAVFGPDIYPLLGVIERRSQDNFGRDWISFAPYLVVSGHFDRRLENGDTIRLFSTSTIRKWMAHEQENAQRAQEQDKNPDLEPNRQFMPVSYIFGETKSENSFSDAGLIKYLKNYALSLRGAVHQPGLYPVAQNISLKALLSSAGGLNPGADRRHVEISRAMASLSRLSGANHGRRFQVNLLKPGRPVVLLGPGDHVKIRDKIPENIDQKVVIKGEVAYPGSYPVSKEDTLLDIIERAGGLTQQAYPEGAILSRADERARQKQAFIAQARDLELSLARQLENKDDENKPGAQEIKSVRKLVARLRDARALGRITVEANPEVLKANPDLNILLDDGDKIYIPKRPLHVRVRGEVLSPSSLQFRKNNSPEDYIRQAGGFTSRADESRSFVIFPDGSAKPLKIGYWHHNDALIPPGSTIVVPLDAKRFDFIDKARDISQILANLVISTVFIADIDD